MFRDRHGKIRWRARGKGRPAVMLPGEYGSTEFVAAWNAWRNGTSRPEAIKIKPGSIASLVTAYYMSGEFRDLAPATRAHYRSTLERFRRLNADRGVGALTREKLATLRDTLQPNAANMLLRVLRHLCRFAVVRNILPADPTAGIRKARSTTTGIHSWSDVEIAQFEARHASGTKARLALALMLYTGQRRGDVIRLGPQHETDGGKALRFRQSKTGAELVVPIVPALRAEIDAGAVSHLAYLTTAQGKPYTPTGFGNWFREKCDEAGLGHCSGHGLRKACATALADAGCSAHEIAAITGHKSLREVERYTRAADQKRLAERAAVSLGRERKRP